ncbi:MAG TPA: sugar phosphate isomerase/epimerase family protein, partial [Candidatus Sulfopaludibacter sp.]|nr:sugar phosphate isomerase/epimerase family protein [Candidatus Sulfopaludibacter sp.]
PADEPRPGKLNVCIFSKHLQFLEGEELAKAVAAIGFDGIDLTVRKGGHVEPDRVKQDLPPLVALLHRHGLATPMVTTDIVDAATPFAEDILRTAADLGIRRYRWMPSGGFKYTTDEPYPAQLERFKARVAKLAELNARCGVGAMYHTHSGLNLVGSSIWDLYILFKDLNPQFIGVNYDIGHATVEGGFGGWINSLRITGPHLRGIAVKDFRWVRNARGEWAVEWVPLGEGMVRFPQFFAMVKQASFDGPVQLHFEYPLGGANDGKRTITMPRGEVFAAMKRDLSTLRGYMANAGV